MLSERITGWMITPSVFLGEMGTQFPDTTALHALVVCI